MTARTIEPLARPPRAVVAVPGSKSLTNRALVAAGLAKGRSRIGGALRADDTLAMVEGLRALGAAIAIEPGEAGEQVTVEGMSGAVAGGVAVDAGLSGTTARFLLPVLALGGRESTLDGGTPLRERPMADAVESLRALGADVRAVRAPGRLPLRVRGPLAGTETEVAAGTSSQFASGLLLAGPCLPAGLDLRLRGAVVSAPYLGMTVAVMEAFGAQVEVVDEGRRYRVRAGGYRGATYDVEPDATAASYFFAAAAITGGYVAVPGLGPDSLQGDVRFVELLRRMGATVEQAGHGLAVRGSAAGLRGGRFDLRDMPDVAQTLAMVAVFAAEPTTITGIEVVRGHETDRIRAVVTELDRCGIRAEEHPDGFTIHPGTPRGTTIETYHDHRMAMSFSLLGLRVPGIAIGDPGCVTKTFPRFFETLELLRISDRGTEG